MLKRRFNSFASSLRAVPFLRRKPVLNLKRLVTLYSAFKTSHLTLAHVKKQNLHLLRLTLTYVKQLTEIQTFKKKKQLQLRLA
jgi:hypothetical protein